MSDYGIKVSDIGDDAVSVDINDLIMSSEHPNPKVKVGQSPEHFGEGEFVVPSGSSPINALTVAHGYTYVPISFCIVKPGTQDFRTAPTLWFFEGPTIDAYCDDTNFKIDIVGPGESNAEGMTLKYRYYIMDRDGT